MILYASIADKGRKRYFREWIDPKSWSVLAEQEITYHEFLECAYKFKQNPNKRD